LLLRFLCVGLAFLRLAFAWLSAKRKPRDTREKAKGKARVSRQTREKAKRKTRFLLGRVLSWWQGLRVPKERGKERITSTRTSG